MREFLNTIKTPLGESKIRFSENDMLEAFDSWLENIQSEADFAPLISHLEHLERNNPYEYKALKCVGSEHFPAYFSHQSFHMTTEQFITFCDLQTKDGILLAFLFLVFKGEREWQPISGITNTIEIKI